MPGYLFEIPVYIYRFFLCLRAGSLRFFSNVNPGMTLSGFAGYGKHEDLDKFEAHLLPKGFLISSKEAIGHIEHFMKQHGFSYPCIAKPTLGRTGRDVKKIHSSQELHNYLNALDEDILMQEFIPDPLEFGIFYYRIPGDDRGHITGIVEKKFMFLQGDGKQTFEELVLNHPRAKYYYHQLKEEYSKKWNTIIPQNEKIQLNYIGNHCRGSTFYDVSHLITPQFETLIDEISKKVNGFYFGRYDIKTKSREDMYAGHFKVIELNGMGSLPTHIYDPNHSLWNAYKVIFSHRAIALRISKANKKKGRQYAPLSEILRIFRKHGI